MRKDIIDEFIKNGGKEEDTKSLIDVSNGLDFELRSVSVHVESGERKNTTYALITPKTKEKAITEAKDKLKTAKDEYGKAEKALKEANTAEQKAQKELNGANQALQASADAMNAANAERQKAQSELNALDTTYRDIEVALGQQPQGIPEEA